MSFHNLKQVARMSSAELASSPSILYSPIKEGTQGIKESNEDGTSTSTSTITATGANSTKTATCAATTHLHQTNNSPMYPSLYGRSPGDNKRDNSKKEKKNGIVPIQVRWADGGSHIQFRCIHLPVHKKMTMNPSPELFEYGDWTDPILVRGPQGASAHPPLIEMDHDLGRFRFGTINVMHPSIVDWSSWMNVRGPTGLTPKVEWRHTEGGETQLRFITSLPSKELRGSLEKQKEEEEGGDWISVSGPRGPRGPPGIKGDIGPIGRMPHHKWVGPGVVQFENPDGSWGDPQSVIFDDYLEQQIEDGHFVEKEKTQKNVFQLLSSLFVSAGEKVKRLSSTIPLFDKSELQHHKATRWIDYFKRKRTETRESPIYQILQMREDMSLMDRILYLESITYCHFTEDDLLEYQREDRRLNWTLTYSGLSTHEQPLFMLTIFDFLDVPLLMIGPIKIRPLSNCYSLLMDDLFLQDANLKKGEPLKDARKMRISCYPNVESFIECTIYQEVMSNFHLENIGKSIYS